MFVLLAAEEMSDKVSTSSWYGLCKHEPQSYTYTLIRIGTNVYVQRQEDRLGKTGESIRMLAHAAHMLCCYGMLRGMLA